MLVEFLLAASDLDAELSLDRDGIIVLELAQLREPAVRLGNFAVALGNFLVDPLGERLVVHDDVD
ncbi:MAG TPA: hypothetical protein VNQ74_09565, partial [Burkholderiaceae bacterium]|nr:hypothetical protein [Burkholderiaceae bacterium]